MKLKIITLLILVVSNATLLKAQLRISQGGTLHNNGGTMTLYNIGIQNDGTLSNSATASVMFGGATNQEIKGTGTYTFQNLAINKPNGGKMTLNNSIVVKGQLAMNNGRLDLGNNKIELIWPAGLIANETEVNRIVTSGTGEVFIKQILNNPSAINPGNLGAVISTSQNMGLTTIRRGHKVDSINGQQSSARYYNITPANNSNLNATLVFKYFDSQLNNVAESSLSLFRKPMSTWELAGKDGSDMINNFIQKNNIASLGLFTLGTGTAVNPVVTKNSLDFVKNTGSRVALTTKLNVIEKDKITIGPNPTTGQLNVAANLMKSDKMNIKVIDMKGSVVMQKQWQAAQGTSVETLHLDNLTSGGYLIQVINSYGTNQTFRVIKQ